MSEHPQAVKEEPTVDKLSHKTIEKILDLYKTDYFPHAFRLTQEGFRRSLKKYAHIDVTKKQLNEILSQNLFYVSHKIGRRRFATLHFISQGNYLDGIADVVYMNFPKSQKIYTFLLVIDCNSRYVWGRLIKKASPVELKKAFRYLLRYEDLPPFPLLRHDNDPSFKKIKPFFKKLHILSTIKRGPHYLTLFEPAAKMIKSTMLKGFEIRSGFQYTNKNVQERLKNAIYGYNHTTLSKYNFKPAEKKTPLHDAELRALYHPHQDDLPPFGAFLSQELKLQTKLQQPNPNDLKEGDGHYRVNDLVMIRLRRSSLKENFYSVQRNEVVRIDKIITNRGSKYLYVLKTLQNTPVAGVYYAAELKRAPSRKFLKVEKIVGRKTIQGKKMLLVHYKNLDESFNQWIPAYNKPSRVVSKAVKK